MAGKLIVHGIDALALNATVDVYLDKDKIGRVKLKSTEEFVISNTGNVSIRCGIAKSKSVKVFSAGITEIQCKWNRITGAVSIEVINESPEIIEMREKEEKKELQLLLEAMQEVEVEKASTITEHRKRCNVCGKIFCYTDADLRANQSHQRWAKAHAVGSLFGTRMDMYGQQNQMQAELDKIVDYSRCPNCKSNNLTDVSREELGGAKFESENSQRQQKVGSVVDELKQFKELLDVGIITQEEFDAKKKQLLGL